MPDLSIEDTKTAVQVGLETGSTTDAIVVGQQQGQTISEATLSAIVGVNMNASHAAEVAKAFDAILVDRFFDTN